MTTRLGKFCIIDDLTVKNLQVETSIDNLTVKNLQVENHITMHENAEIKIPSTGTNDHEHFLSTNHSVVYFKYLFQNKITKFTTFTGTQVLKITFAKDHHFTDAESGIKMTFSGAPTSSNLRGLAATDFEGKVDIMQYQATNIQTGWSVASNELEFETSTPATSTGIIDASAMVGSVKIYKYLDLAGGGTTWQIAFDDAPGALHE
jgi:hypothetical protein